MKIRDRIGLLEKTQKQLSRLMQFLLPAIAVFGFYIGSPSVMINATIGFLVTLLPGILRRDYNIPMDPALVLWITSAVFLHAVGTLGPYYYFWWWDHLTHALSASVVAAVGYATMRSLDRHYEELYLPPRFMFIFILVFVLAFGVIWEVIEFSATELTELIGSERIITQHSLEDTMKDLLFNLGGGVIIATWGEIYLNKVIEQLHGRLREGRGS